MKAESGGTNGVWNRTLAGLRTAWRDLSRKGRDSGPGSGGHQGISPDLPDAELPVMRQRMTDCLEGRGGEVSARARAADLGRTYLNLDATGRARFLRLLAQEFDVDPAAVDAAVEARRAAGDDSERRAARRQLARALRAPWLDLLTQFNALPQGVKFLVDLRADLLPLTRDDPDLRALDADLKQLLTSWFDVGFLSLHRITWRSSALVLEKIIAYEAVHAIQSWDDLKDRLDSDRRLYAFFHPAMPEEPLIFVEVALTRGLADSIPNLLDASAPAEDPENADTAVFYSISNAQKGLTGISFGNFLIKTVVQELRREFPQLATFATLSPVPGFRRWLEGQIEAGDSQLLKPNEHKALKGLAHGRAAKGSLKAFLEDRSWPEDAAVATALREPLTRLCARYLVQEKRDDGRARDPVAHFHLSNGARVERINWMGDPSAKGLEQACGLMVNYLYDLDHIEANQETYTGSGHVIASNQVRNLLKA